MGFMAGNFGGPSGFEALVKPHLVILSDSNYPPQEMWNGGDALRSQPHSVIQRNPSPPYGAGEWGVDGTPPFKSALRNFPIG
jgi:hypothetical protein